MKTIIFILCTFIFLTDLMSQVQQQWAARYNAPENFNDYCYGVISDDSGNVYVTGFIETLLLGATIKYNSSGIQQWINRFSSFGGVSFHSIKLDGSGNVYVGGSSSINNGYRNVRIVKYSSSGVQQWSYGYQVYGHTFFSDMEVDQYGNVYACGTWRDYINANIRTWRTMKISSSGQLVWLASYSGNVGINEVNSLSIDNNANVIVTGEVLGVNNNPDYATVKYDSSGQMQWQKRYNGLQNGRDKAVSVTTDNSGDVYITGESGLDTASLDYVTIRYNGGNGDTIWVRKYHYGNKDIPYSIAVDNSSNVFVTGGSQSTGAGFDYATIKYNSNGVQQWIQRYNGNGNADDYANVIVLDNYGGVYVTGSSVGFGTLDDYVTIKYNFLGIQQWLKRYNGTGSGNDRTYSLFVDNSGAVYTCGASYGVNNNYDYSTVKYTQYLNAPALISPPNDTTNQLLSFTFHWNNVIGAAFYKIQVATDSSFLNLILNDSTLIDSTRAISGLSPLTTYWWRVNARNGFGTSPYSLIWRFTTGNFTIIEPVSIGIPKTFKLYSNYPNPFNPVTKIKFDLPEQSFTKIVIYDMLGREVAAIVNQQLQAGSYSVDFDGSRYSSGVYFYRLETESFADVKKMVLVR